MHQGTGLLALFVGHVLDLWDIVGVWQRDKDLSLNCLIVTNIVLHGVDQTSNYLGGVAYSLEGAVAFVDSILDEWLVRVKLSLEGRVSNRLHIGGASQKLSSGCDCNKCEDVCELHFLLINYRIQSNGVLGFWQARAGSVTAIEKLPEYSQAIEQAVAASAVNASDVAYARAWLA